MTSLLSVAQIPAAKLLQAVRLAPLGFGKGATHLDESPDRVRLVDLHATDTAAGLKSFLEGVGHSQSEVGVKVAAHKEGGCFDLGIGTQDFPGCNALSRKIQGLTLYVKPRSTQSFTGSGGNLSAMRRKHTTTMNT